MTASNAPALRARIDRAFAGSAYPGDSNIGLNTPNCPGYEGTVVAEFFKGKDWRQITFPSIAQGYDAPLHALPAFMTAEALAYYLPAFLIMALDLTPGADGELGGFVDSLCFHLTRPSPDGLADQYELVKDMPEVPDEVKEHLRNPTPEAKAAQRTIVENHERLVGLLSPEQRSAVAAALEHVAELLRRDSLNENFDKRFNDARRALDRGWSRFAD